MVAREMDQPMVHSLRLRRAHIAGSGHGHSTYPYHPAAEGPHLPHGEEELHVECKDARAEAENRGGHQAIRQARGSDAEEPGADADVLTIRREPVGRLPAHAYTDAYLDCDVLLRAQCHPAARREFPLDERSLDLRPHL